MIAKIFFSRETGMLCASLAPTGAVTRVTKHELQEARIQAFGELSAEHRSCSQAERSMAEHIPAYVTNISQAMSRLLYQAFPQLISATDIRPTSPTCAPKIATGRTPIPLMSRA